jgi:hypothetical protein
MPDLAELMANNNRTAFETAMLRDRIHVLEAMLSNMRKLLDKRNDEEWTDYSDISTITGWSSLTKQILVRSSGLLVTVWFLLSGTSNSTLARFTVPYGIYGAVETYEAPMYAVDDGVPSATPGRAWISTPGSTLVYLNTDYSGGLWTASGTKQAEGTICYRRR